MGENMLPTSVIKKASVRGDEYAWKLSDVEEAINAGRAAGLANVGGQAQFRVPDGTCEMYWLCVTAKPRGQYESWSQYVERSANEVLGQVREIIEKTNFREEAMKWPMLVKRIQEGDNILNYAFFVLYFEANRK
jgi:hypothetical protein